MENNSKITIDDSCTSMYFSFNSTSANKTVEAMDSITETSHLPDDPEGEQNVTLEAAENNDAPVQVQTVKKLSFGVSPLKAVPKNIMQAYKTLSSTPTKAQLLRSVEVTRGSGSVDVCDLGLAFLEAPQESIINALVEDKENLPQESQEIYSETSSEIVVSVIEKTQEEEQPVPKKVGFSNLPVLKTSSNMNVRGTPKPSRPSLKCEPDLKNNRPSRIAPKRFSLHPKMQLASNKEFAEDDVPKMITSMLKLSGALSAKGKPPSNTEQKPFNLLGKATRMSILKTTLNSPARKAARKSVNTVPVIRSSIRQSLGNKRMTMIPNMSRNARTSIVPPESHRIYPTTSTSPSKRMPSNNSRKNFVPPKQKPVTTLNPSRRTMTTSSMIPIHASDLRMKPPIAQFIPMPFPKELMEDYTCDVCKRKFRVHSLFDAHKKTHQTAGTSSKQTFATNDKQCRYCDKKFAIAKALTNHLLEKCTKIPPGDKKKLLFCSDQTQAANAAKHRAPIFKKPTILSSCDSLSSNSTQSTGNQFQSNDRSMLQSSVNKMKNKLPHSGVYCTPNKMISCHVCKHSFSSILAFAEHSLTHSTAADNGAVAATSESTQTQIDLNNDSTQTTEHDVSK